MIPPPLLFFKWKADKVSKSLVSVVLWIYNEIKNIKPFCAVLDFLFFIFSHRPTW